MNGQECRDTIWGLSRYMLDQNVHVCDCLFVSTSMCGYGMYIYMSMYGCVLIYGCYACVSLRVCVSVYGVCMYVRGMPSECFCVPVCLGLSPVLLWGISYPRKLNKHSALLGVGRRSGVSFVSVSPPAPGMTPSHGPSAHLWGSVGRWDHHMALTFPSPGNPTWSFPGSL